MKGNRNDLPIMHSNNVSTVISDSGITRYRVNTPEWYVYDRAQEPFWLFPKGGHFEKFDEQLNVSAELDADSVIFFNKLEKWILAGDVRAVNLDGEQFETDTLYIDQKDDRIHTNLHIKVTQEDKIIEGIGFESNQSLSKYTILNPTGVIPVEEDE